jgi:ATP adenylyltransferase
MGRRVDVQNASTRARGDYAQALAKIEADGVCPFCQAHLARLHTKPILFQSRHWIVTENAWPYDGTRHQFLLIHRDHIESAEELPSGAWESLGSAYRRLVNEYLIEGAALLLRTGKTDFTGASVAHLHAQLISGGRREADSELIRALVGFKARHQSGL